MTGTLAQFIAALMWINVCFACYLLGVYSEMTPGRGVAVLAALFLIAMTPTIFRDKWSITFGAGGGAKDDGGDIDIDNGGTT